MSEVDEQRRRAETLAVAETPPAPPEPPPHPTPIEGQGHTGPPREGRTEPGSALNVEQQGIPELVTGKPVEPQQDHGNTSDDIYVSGDPVNEQPATDSNAASHAADTQPDGRGTTVSDADTGPGGELTSAHTETRAEEPRFNRKDMQPTGRTDPLYHEDLYLGPDGKEHFDGDPLDTRRNIQGRLINPDGTYIPDPNPRPTDNLQERAQQDLPTRRYYQPEPGATQADDAVTAEKSEREHIEQARDATWNKIKDIADKLAPHDVKVEKSNDRNENDGLLLAATDHLSAAERLKLGNELPKLAKLNQDLKDASERLGTAGGALAVQREFPGAVLVSGGDGQKGTPGNLDRVVMIDERKQAVIIVEEKGVSSGLGSRIVPDTARPGGKNIRAEQGSTSYLRHLLQTDNKLAAALDRSPALRQKMQAIINGGGQIRYLAARTTRDGKISVTDFKLDFGRLRRATIVLPTRRRGA